MSTVPQFIGLLNTHASQARYYRSSDTAIPCPCRTPEGFRDAELHLAFGKYGPGSQEITDGSFAAGTTLNYVFIAVNGNGTMMYPAKVFPPITSDEDFGVHFDDITWPDMESLQEFRIYRSSDGGATYYNVGVVDFPTAGYIDNGPAPDIPGGVLPVPVICNEAGMIPQDPIDVIVKAFVQPIQSTRATRLSTEYLQEVFGQVEADDHLGIFPITWGGVTLKFDMWSQSGDDFIEYNGRRFYVVNSNTIPDPGDGNPEHHFEIGLRLLRSDGFEA